MTKKSATPMDHLRSRKTPSRRSVRISEDEELTDRYREARQDLDLAKTQRRLNPTNPAFKEAVAVTQKALADVEKEMAGKSIKFTFASIGYKAYDELLADHNMSVERIQELVDAGTLREEDREDASWDPTTFPQGLIVRCLKAIDDEEKDIPSEEELLEWFSEPSWTSTEINELFAAAMQVNIGSRVVRLGNG